MNTIKALTRRFLAALGLQIVLVPREDRNLFLNHSSLHYKHLVARDVLNMRSGQVDTMEALALGEIARGLVDVGPIIEIGTLFGWSTQVLALFKARDRELITIDNYSWNPFGIPCDLHKEITRNILGMSAEHLRVSTVNSDSQSFLRLYSGPPPALVFIDGSHEYSDVAAEISLAKGIGSRVICGHDYDPIKCPGVVKAVKENGDARHLFGRVWVL